MLRVSTVAFSLLFASILTGCYSTASVSAEERAGPETLGAVEHALRAEAEAWRGTPYRYGGTSRSGIDCSAFVQTVFQESFTLELPRATAGQVHEGRPVNDEGYVPGDLLFFRPRGRRSRHVGIYLGRGEFVHASSSEGVTVSRLDDAYWRRTFWKARRVLPQVEAPPRPGQATAGWSRAATAGRTGSRSGW